MNKRPSTKPTNAELSQLKEGGGKWLYFPEQLQTGRFGGLVTRDDATQIRGVSVIGQNITFIGTDNPTVRKGYEVVGTEASDATPVNRAWIFETREGAKFELKGFSTKVQFWLEGVSTTYLDLLTGLTTGLEFGYANISDTTATTAKSLFCNGTDNWYEFNGAYATISGSTADTLSIASGTWTALGFYGTGTRSVIINGTVYSYTGGEGTATLTGVTPDPTAQPVAVGDLAVQSPLAVSAMSSVKGQVAFAHDGRIHARLETKKSVWNYSQLDDPDDWTAGASDGDGGAKEVEFGGPITSFGKLNKTVLCFKPRIIKLLDFIQVGSRIDSPRYQTLVSTDDKSTSLGAVNQKSTFSTPKGIVFVTPDKRMMLLSGVTANNEPEYYPLSEPVQPIFDKGVHDEATGICVDNVIYYAFKENKNSTYNDTVLVGDLTRFTPDANGSPVPIRWDAPYIGWNVSDWTAIESNTDKKIEVRWHSAINSSSYRIINSKTDNTGAFTTTFRTWSETFDLPYKRKTIDMVYIEMKMSEITEVTATILYDEDGVTGQETFVLDADSANHKFTKITFNPFGASSFGSQQFGSNPENDDMSKYRFFIELKKNVKFFTVALQLSTDGDAQNYELVRFGYRLREVENDIEYKYKLTSSSV
jgi:hypothetical protein